MAFKSVWEKDRCLKRTRLWMRLSKIAQSNCNRSCQYLHDRQSQSCPSITPDLNRIPGLNHSRVVVLVRLIPKMTNLTISSVKLF